MADSLLSSIATFHTMKIIVTDPAKFSFIGPIPEAMLGHILASSSVLQQYRKRPSLGPRELTPTMVRSIEEADKPAKSAAPSQPQLKKKKKPARRLILQSSSDSDSEYVLPMQKNALPSESESESSDEEASGRGDTPTRSPTPEIPVHSFPPSPPPVTIPVSIPPVSPITTSQPFTTIPIPTPIFTDTTTTTSTTKPAFTASNPPSEDDDDEPITKRHLKAVNDKIDQLLSSSSSGTHSEAALKSLFSSVVAEHSATLFAAAKAIEASSSQCQQSSLAVDASTKECKEATPKVNKLISEAHLFLDSLQAAAAKNAATVNTSVETL
ncbi:pollen-specific leucine-rich repeat extensin-like protein 2 [Lactuca sativa]|uniref:pollen-specific leucine-rich repeat extensin-like protein 2 n=1 Tax=Lactuca sativa TaxID=4236 RepID=UPI0022AE5C58|nr:pollen-specific leucine-rich repeat extensin-like protein 2 [Lactuca sativa]